MDNGTENGLGVTESSAFSLDDPAVANIASELGGPDGDGGDLSALLERVNRLVEFVENDELNALINFPLYGILLNELSAMRCLAPYHEVFERFIEEYISTLDKLDARIPELFPREELSGAPISDLPSLINESRSDPAFDKQRRKELKQLSRELPDVKKNLDTIETIILGI